MAYIELTADDTRIEQMVTLGSRHARCTDRAPGGKHDMLICDRADAVAHDASGTWMTAESAPVDPYRRQPCGHLQMMRAFATGACQQCAGNVSTNDLDGRGGLIGVTVADLDEAGRFRDDYIAAGLPIPPFVYRGGGVAAYPPEIGAPGPADVEAQPAHTDQATTPTAAVPDGGAR